MGQPEAKLSFFQNKLNCRRIELARLSSQSPGHVRKADNGHFADDAWVCDKTAVGNDCTSDSSWPSDLLNIRPMFFPFVAKDVL